MNEDQALEIAQRIAQETGKTQPSKVIVREHGPRVRRGDYFIGISYLALDLSDASLVVGRRLLRQAPEEVVEALIAHEIGHLLSTKSMPRVLFERLTQVMTSWVVLMFLSGASTFAAVSGNVTTVGVAALVALVILLLNAVYGTLLRAEEYAADEFGASVVGGEAMARAVEWLSDRAKPPNMRLMRVMQTHPAAAKRIRRLESQLAAGGAA